VDASSVIRQLRTAHGTEDPYSLYADARKAGPVLRDATYTLVTTYAEADQVLRSPQFAAAPQSGYADAAKVRPPQPATAVSVLRAAGPDHVRMRRVLNPPFQRNRMQQLRDLIEECAEPLVRSATATSGTIEFMDAIGYQLPIAVICEMLGVPADQRPRMRAVARARTIFLEPMPAQAEIDAAIAAQGEVYELFGNLVRERRAAPSDDLISELLQSVDDEDAQLSEAELFVNLSLMLIAGFETTAGLLGNALAQLLAHDEIYDALRADPDLIPAFVTEVLRYDPPVQLVTRTAADERAAIDGVAVAPGNLVMVLIGAANRDPAHYPDPDVFAPFTRVPTKNLSFGAGAHFCLGAGLAQLEAEVLVRVLVDAPIRITAAGNGTRVPDRIAIRSYATLPVHISVVDVVDVADIVDQDAADGAPEAVGGASGNHC
jgi:cytochrome P450